MKYSFIFALFLIHIIDLDAQSVTEIKRFDAPNATQAVAVDSLFFYTISNSKIVKRQKSDGMMVAEWTGPLKHLNSGVVIENKLYCANTNYPESPMFSSLEIFDTRTLEHIGNHSFGHYIGSFTWIDKWQGDWYLMFVHYDQNGKERDKGAEYTTLIRTDSLFRQLEGWAMPKNLTDHIRPMSVSGGAFTKKGDLIFSPHHFEEIYQFKFPEIGYEMQWIATIPVPFQGQGLAVDKYDDSIWGIHRQKRQVIAIKIDP